MSKPGKKSTAKSTKAGGEKYLLRLFVAGDEPNSKQARENLRELCEEHLAGRHEIEIVDVLRDFQTALQANVLVTPTLILVEPEPSVTILGNLSNTQKVLTALRLRQSE